MFKAKVLNVIFSIKGHSEELSNVLSVSHTTFLSLSLMAEKKEKETPAISTLEFNEKSDSLKDPAQREEEIKSVGEEEEEERTRESFEEEKKKKLSSSFGELRRIREIKQKFFFFI